MLPEIQEMEPFESIGVIMKNKESLMHLKGINKLLPFEENKFFTGGRDGVIKLWENNEKENCLDLIKNFDCHLDWVNDLAISETPQNILFSCSNDKTVNLWSLTENGMFQDNVTTIHQYHSDYIKTINYNRYTAKLFSAGLDGQVVCNNIEEYNKTGTLTYNKKDNCIYTTPHSESIYCIDSDYSGNLILCGAYENNLFCLDRRQKKEILHLRGHKDLVRAAISASSDKSIKVWDLRTHKVLKSWEYHSDSIHSIYMNEGFSKILSGSRNGDVYLSDISLGCYCKMTNVDEIVTSLFMNSKNDIFMATSKGDLHEIKINNTEQIKSKTKVDIIPSSKKKDQILPHDKKNGYLNSNSNMRLPKKKYLYQVNSNLRNTGNEHNLMHLKHREEVLKYHLMKNKIYLLCETVDKVIVYNILKLERIHEFKITNSQTFEKLIEIISKYDQVSLKSWFQIDIKLGTPTIILTKELIHNNPLQFDTEYLEKIIERTNAFTKSSNVTDIKFICDNSFHSNLSSTTAPTSFISSNKLSQSSVMIEKGASVSSSNFKKNSIVESCGENLIKLIFSKWVRRKSEVYKPFFDEYFYDTRGWIKNYLLNYDLSKQPKNSMANNSFFIFSTSDSSITIAVFNDEVPINYNLPKIASEFVKPIYFNTLPPPVVKKEKIEIIIDNRKKEFKNINDNNDTDELEAYGYITVEAFKNWLMKSYLDVEHLKNILVKKDLATFSDKKANIVKQTYLSDPNLYGMFVDFYLQNGVYVKDNRITIEQLNEYFFPKSTLTIGLRYASIDTLIQRKIIKLS